MAVMDFDPNLFKYSVVVPDDRDPTAWWWCMNNLGENFCINPPNKDDPGHKDGLWTVDDHPPGFGTKDYKGSLYWFRTEDVAVQFTLTIL